MEHIYEKKLSDCVKLLMYQVMKNSTQIVQGFIFFRNRTIIKAHYDEDGCDELLKAMVINKNNVLTYLERKYIPSYNEKGATFKHQACIQKVMIMPDKTLYIHIKNSEPHKIITDTVHVMGLLKAHGFDFIPELKYYIEQVKIAYQDTMLYNLCITEFGFKVPASAKIYERELVQKFGKLEDVVKIKKRSVKRKFCRWHVKRGMMTWQQLRNIINVDDFSESNIHHVCQTIRAENTLSGIKFNY